MLSVKDAATHLKNTIDQYATEYDAVPIDWMLRRIAAYEKSAARKRYRVFIVARSCVNATTDSCIGYDAVRNNLCAIDPLFDLPDALINQPLCLPPYEGYRNQHGSIRHICSVAAHWSVSAGAFGDQNMSKALATYCKAYHRAARRIGKLKIDI